MNVAVSRDVRVKFKFHFIVICMYQHVEQVELITDMHMTYVTVATSPQL